MADRSPLYHAVIKKEGHWWIGRVVELPGVNCQERTKSALLDSLRTGLAEMQELSRTEVLRMAAEGFVEETITL